MVVCFERLSSLRSNDFECFECEDNTKSDNRIDNNQDNSHEAFIAGLSQLLVSGKTFIGKESKNISIEIRYQRKLIYKSKHI